MKNRVLKTCLTALALSVAGLANAQEAGEPVKIFTEQLTSHAAISAAAISISADAFVDGHIASQAAATTGARSEVQNIVSGAATGIGAAAKSCNIYAGAAIAVGAGSTVGALSAGGAITLGALTQSDVICDPAPAVVTSDFDAANAQIKSAQTALDTIPASSLVDAYTLVGSMDTGVYEGAAITIPANTLITFDANGEDGVWIFNLSGAMTVGAGSEFEIINPGDNNAVIWNIGGALTLGAGSTFLGTAFVEGAVSGATASVSCGNLYATGAISIGSIGSIGGDDCKVAADQLADFAIEDGGYSVGEVIIAATCPVWDAATLTSLNYQAGKVTFRDYWKTTQMYGPLVGSSYRYTQATITYSYASREDLINKDFRAFSIYMLDADGVTTGNANSWGRNPASNDEMFACRDLLRADAARRGLID
jgi:hypothetical protein